MTMNCATMKPEQWREMGMTTYENLTVEKNGSVATVTFNRPDKANALDQM